MKLLVTGGAGFIGSNYIRYVLGEYPDYRDRKIHEVLNKALFENPIDEDSPDFYNFSDMQVVLFNDNDCKCFGGPQSKPLTTVKMS